MHDNTLRATVFVHPGTRYCRFDYLAADLRVIGVEFEGLSIQLSGHLGDAAVVAAAGALIDELVALRNAAAWRVAEAEAARLAAADAFGNEVPA